MTSTRGAILLKVIMGLTLVIMGSGAALYLWGSWKRAEETRSWRPVEAIVIASQVLTDRATPHSPLKFKGDVHYRYTFDGETHTSTRIRRVDGPSSHKSKAEEVVARYPVGKPVTCFVNPAQPNFAILEHDTRAALYSIWFPLLFVAGGAGMVVSAMRNRPSTGANT
jgi:hypothetical protein